MSFLTTRIFKNPVRLKTRAVAFRGGVTLISSACDSGVMDGNDCTHPVVAGWVDARHCVAVRDMSRRAETGAVFAVEVCCLTATPLKRSLC